jgi:fibronectin-binding autotransporter adhesin
LKAAMSAEQPFRFRPNRHEKSSEDSMFAQQLARFRFATAVAAGLASLAVPQKSWGIAWNATDPSSSAISNGGLTDNYGQFVDESIVTNTQQGEFGTGTYLGNGWLLTALHVVSGSTYGVLVPDSSIQVNVYGTIYTLDNYQTFGSSDIVLCHLAGYTSGPASNLVGVERSQIYTGSSETGNLEQLGGFGVNDQLNSGTYVNNETFHRGFNIAYSDGGFIDVNADGNSRLVQDGYLLGYQQAGDSGSGLWMDNGPDQDLDLHDWSLIGALDTGTTPGYFGDGGQYARVSSYASTIIGTLFPHAWLTWTTIASSAAAVDGSGVWNLTSTNFTDGANYAFNGPERTQIAIFGAGNGAAGTVTLGANINIDSLTFNAAGSGNYTIAGGGYSLHLTQGSTITTNVNATISANMTGGSSTQFGAVNEVIKNGIATLTLTGQSTLDSGATFHARAGTTIIDSGGSFSAPWYTSIGVYTGDTATLTVRGTGSFSTGSDFNLGDLGGAGTLNVQNSASLTATTMYIGKGIGGLTGSGGTGTVNQSGGTVTAPYISLATNHPASLGTYNLNSGNLFTTSITGGLGTSTFNFNGGQVIASGTSSTLMQNLTSATINASANINTNGYNVTLAQPLLHASAAPITDGGLTKSGIGTLTLGGASTYTGPTVINAGAISLNPAAGAAAVAIQPIASYSFDNVSGTTVVNGGSGGAAMNGTLTGDATIVSGGKFGNAVRLSGNGSVVVDSPITDTGGAANWTLSAWVDTTTPGASIVDKSDGGWTWDNGIFYLGGGNGPGTGGVPSAVRYGRGFFQAASSTPSVDDGKWHLVTYVDAAGNYSIYTDGTPVALSNGNSGFIQAVEQGSTVSFGITTDSFPGDGTVNFNGMLDEIQIYNRALTASQIQGLYTSNSPNPLPASSVLPSTTPLTLAAGASLDVNGMSQTIGSLTGSAGSYVSLGTGQLTIGSAASTQFAGAISGNGGSLVKQGAGSLTLAGADTYTGATTVSAGTLLINAAGALPAASNVTITGGTLQLGASTGAETLSSLSVTGGGVFDVNNNHIIISYAPGSHATADATIRGYLISGYANGAWNGAEGIDSSAASALFASGNTRYGLGYADGADGIVSGLSSGQIEVTYTLYGNANLDGVVNGTDFGILAAHFGEQVGGWDQGDFNYDGVVNGTDFGALAANFGQQVSGAAVELPASDWAALDSFAAANGLLADVPEPASAGLMVLAGIGAIGRRRRRGGPHPCRSPVSRRRADTGAGFKCCHSGF